MVKWNKLWCDLAQKFGNYNYGKYIAHADISISTLLEENTLPVILHLEPNIYSSAIKN